MSERKVLNKYYPPSFDPSKIPKVKGPKNRTFSIRIMAPFNMRCNTCGVYIYKGKKFNSRKENVDDEDYYGLRIFRFYIKCPCCVSEIAFKTDLKNTDYALEAGATRLFEAEKLAQQMAERERQAQEAEDMNPMKVLENRTKASRSEIEQLDTLEELREMNTRNAAVDHEHMIKLHEAYEETLKKLQDEEDENTIKSIFGRKDGQSVKRLADSDSDEETSPPPDKKKHLVEKPTDFLSEEKKPQKIESWQKSVGSLSSKNSKKSLAGLIVKKKPKVETTIKTETSPVISANHDVANNINQSAGLIVKKKPKVETTIKTETSPVMGANHDVANNINQSEAVLHSRYIKLEKSEEVDAPKDFAKETVISQSESKPGASALSMLGSYSDSSEDSE